MFHSFEHFVIMNTEEELNMSGQADAPHNFDKISFLSEQVFFVQFRRFFSTLWSGSGLNFFFDPIRILVFFWSDYFYFKCCGSGLGLFVPLDPDWDVIQDLWIRILDLTRFSFDLPCWVGEPDDFLGPLLWIRIVSIFSLDLDPVFFCQNLLQFRSGTGRRFFLIVTDPDFFRPLVLDPIFQNLES